MAAALIATLVGFQNLPPPPYDDGRWSDGLALPELLAIYLNMTLVDYAVGGATALPGPAYLTIDPPYANLTKVFQLPVPAVQDQVRFAHHHQLHQSNYCQICILPSS